MPTVELFEFQILPKMGKKKMKQMRKEEIERQNKMRVLLHTSKPLARISFLVNDVANLKNICTDPNILHRFHIYKIRNFGGAYILRSMLKSIYPVELTPLNYATTPSGIYFLAANCVDAIVKFIENGLSIPHKSSYCKIDILANFCEAKSLNLDNLENNLSNELNKRFNVEFYYLSLDSFSNTDELLDYYPLYQSSTLTYILEQSLKFHSLKKISLRSNNIKHVKDLSPLKCLQIEVLDLSNNEISSIDDLQGLKILEFLIILNLQMNPICSRYDSNTYNYVTDVKSVCNRLQKLDGFDVSTSPSFKRNFLRSSDADDLCTQFLEHFFTLYDSKDKQNLADLYDKDAVLSVSSKIVPNQKNSDSVRLSHYGIESPYIIVGITYIMKFFNELGRIYHDPYSFVCDLTIYTPTFAVLSIGGLFRESNQILGFSRTFVLKGTGEEYCITNDQLLVYNVLDYQLSWSFSYPRKVKWTGDLLPYYPEQYGLIDCYIESVTGMNMTFTQKILRSCKYDPEKALIEFCELLINNKIPRKAFVRRYKTNQQFTHPFFNKIRGKAVMSKTVWDTMNIERMENTKAHVPRNLIKDKKILLKPIIERWRVKREAMPRIFYNEENFPMMHCDPEPTRVSAALLAPFQPFQRATDNQSQYSVPYYIPQFTSFGEPVEPMPLAQHIERTFYDDDIIIIDDDHDI